MALNSPGVQVSIIDQSQYLPAAPGSTPLILVATALNKSTPAGNAIASGTLETNANHLFLATSQSDLVTSFGNPFFYKTADGTPIHGYELNEYGLLAAYSALGISSSVYILRADIDLGQLVGTLVRPVGNPPDGTYWLDSSSNSSWGIYEFNSATGTFTNQIPYVTVASDLTTYGSQRVPQFYLGAIGSYAVIPEQIAPNGRNSGGTYFYKNYGNNWVVVGSREWKLSIPTITGSNSNPTLTAGDSFTINVGSHYSVTNYSKQITISAGETITSLVTKINQIGDSNLLARQDSNGRLVISYASLSLNSYITLISSVNDPVGALGIVTGNIYYCPELFSGDSNQMPLWGAGQQFPHPSKSVWIKTSVSGNGIGIAFNQFSVAQNAWSSVPVNIYYGTNYATAMLDNTGGQAIPAGTTIATIGANNSANTTGMLLFKRKTSSVPAGAAANSYQSGYVSEVFGTQVLPTISNGLNLYIGVSIPGTNNINSYVLTTNGTDLYNFVSSWNAFSIANTVIDVASTGVIYIRHTLGGEIYLNDIDTTTGISNGLLVQLGLDTASNPAVSYGSALNRSVAAALQNSTSGGGVGAEFKINLTYDYYEIQNIVGGGGTGYAINDTITIHGSHLFGADTTNDLIIRVENVGLSGNVTQVAYVSGIANIQYGIVISGWTPVTYTVSPNAPAKLPLDGAYWYYSTISNVDIMVNQNGVWKGYQNCAYDLNGHPVHTGTNATDPNGPIISASTPTTHSDGVTPLAYGDLWIDSGDLENYPALARWQSVNGVDQWVDINKGDAVSSSGILFADARWDGTGTTDPVLGTIPQASTLLAIDRIDLDAPAADMYPQGMLLFNTRLSGYNVKKFSANYFTTANFGTGVSLPSYPYTWMNASGLDETGAAYMGRKSQRHMVVMALKSAINTNTQIREEDTFFNLITCPGYPELQPDMVTLNNDRNQTAFIIGDTPLRLPSDGTALVDWATNAALATQTGEDGWVTRDTYLGVFYPSGITTDLSGADAVVPASHMMLYTIINNDTIAYPWFAPAGTQRGLISNASNIGYIDAKSGLFKVIKTRQSIRDVLYENQINPLTFFTGIGLLNYGNKSSFASQSSLDRINVARLIAYIRYQLQIVSRPFVFQPNDSLTRSQLAGVVQSLFVGLVAQRGLYDYLVVCDASNNTPARIDANELWVDIAIEPTIAAEFIYIPVRVLATGGIAKLK